MKRSMSVGSVLLLGLLGAAGCSQLTVRSPGGDLAATIHVDGNGQLTYSVQHDRVRVLEDSPLGITVDGIKLGAGVTLGAAKTTTVNETYASRGVHTMAVNHYTGAVIPVTHQASGLTYTLEVRAYDDGLAYRYVVPGRGERRITGEASAWTLPAGCSVWYQSNTKNYESIHRQRTAESFKKDTKIGPPMVAVLPDRKRYVAITEGALTNYSGMTLRSAGGRVFEAAFEDDRSWKLTDTITTPWRITLVSADLNGLVNADIVANVNPPPSAELAGASWIRPGRATWSWWSQGTGRWSLQKRYADMAAELGFEYILIDEGWEKWRDGSKDKWGLVKEVVDHAKRRNVDVWVWKRWLQIAEAKVRDRFFARVKGVGVVGVKVDFMDSESKARIDFYTACLRDAARHRLMVNFHGANKPTGESRTWPNEMTREGVQGLEYNKWTRISSTHNVTIPFTRFLAGHGDYTPCTFDPKRMRGTSWAHQLACAIVFTSPVTCWADNPKNYLGNPARDVLETIPPVWDETRVLAVSEIGNVAAFARRSGKTWFVGILNGRGKRMVEIDLAFLGPGTYQAVTLADDAGKPDAFVRSEKRVRSGDVLKIVMRTGGGYVARFTPSE